MPDPIRHARFTGAPVFRIADTPGNAGNRAVFSGRRIRCSQLRNLSFFIRPRPSSTRPAPPCLANHHPAKAPKTNPFHTSAPAEHQKRGRSLQTSSFSGNLSFFKIVRCFRGKNRAPRHRLPPSHKAVDLKSTADVRHANSLFDPTTSILDSTGR